MIKKNEKNVKIDKFGKNKLHIMHRPYIQEIKYKFSFKHLQKNY